MSIFKYQYIDEILLQYCNADIDLFHILKRINKYYCAIIIINDNYKFWISLLNDNKKKSNNKLFVDACSKGNIVICNYIINKFNNININANNERAFRFNILRSPCFAIYVQTSLSGNPNLRSHFNGPKYFFSAACAHNSKILGIRILRSMSRDTMWALISFDVYAKQ